MLHRRISLNELNSLVDEFVVKHDQLKKDLEEILKKLTKFVKITEDGEILFQEMGGNLSIKDKAFLVILVRYVATKLNEVKKSKIISNVNIITKLKDVQDAIGLSGKSANSLRNRINELINEEKVVKRVKKGNYTIANLRSAINYMKKIEVKIGKMK